VQAGCPGSSTKKEENDETSGVRQQHDHGVDAHTGHGFVPSFGDSGQIHAGEQNPEPSGEEREAIDLIQDRWPA
jgi:hypothetical protein